MKPHVLWALLVLAAAWLQSARAPHGAGLLSAAQASPAPAASPADPSPDDTPDESLEQASRSETGEFEDFPEPLVEQTPRSEEAARRMDAASLFAAGRMQEQDEHYAQALKLYQRALRQDPRALPILRQLIDLARRMDRPAEAARYAARAAELAPTDARWLWDLGELLAQQGDLATAISLYERSRAQLPPGKSPALVLISMDLGRMYFLAERLPQAAEMFALVMEALEHPAEYRLDDNVRSAFTGEAGQRAYELFGTAMLVTERFDDAQRAFDKLHELAPDDGLLALHSAQILAGKKQFPEALEELEKCLQAKGSFGLAPYELLERLLTGLDRGGELITRLEAFATADPQNSLLSFFLARKFVAAGRLDEAEARFSELLKSQPLAEAYQELCRLYHSRGKLEALLPLVGDVAGRSGGLQSLGSAAMELRNDDATVNGLIQLARARYAADADSLDFGARLAVALLALEAEKFEAANEFFGLAVRVKPGDRGELWLSWGVGLLVSEQYKLAGEVFQRGIDEKVLPTGNPSFHYFLAGALAMLGQTDDALAAAGAASGMQPDNPRLAARVPWILYFARRHSEARDAYRHFISRFDESHQDAETRDELRQARLVLSNIYVMEENLPMAEELLEEVLDEFPEDVSAMNDLGYLLADQGKQLERALHMIRQAVQSEAENVAYRDSLGWVLHRLGKNEEAFAELTQAASGEGPDPVILDHLGDVALALGRTDEAAAAWARAVAMLTKPEDEKKLAPIKKKLAELRGST